MLGGRPPGGKLAQLVRGQTAPALATREKRARAGSPGWGPEQRGRVGRSIRAEERMGPNSALPKGATGAPDTGAAQDEGGLHPHKVAGE